MLFLPLCGGSCRLCITGNLVMHSRDEMLRNVAEGMQVVLFRDDDMMLMFGCCVVISMRCSCLI